MGFVDSSDILSIVTIVTAGVVAIAGMIVMLIGSMKGDK